MSGKKPLKEQEFFPEDEPSSARIETQGGTVYWLSQADENGVRWVVREHLKTSDTNTMVMHKASKSGEIDLGDKFQGLIRSNVEMGSPFIIEVVDKESRILSEPVVGIEIGNVPEMLFG